MTIGRLIYATDFSPPAEAAWPAARELAKALGAEAVVLHVVPPLTAPPEGYFAADVFSRYWEGARAQAEAELAKVVALAVAAGVKARPRVDHGRPVNEILAAAAEEQADLLVLGTAGRSGLQRLFIGSVAEELLRSAPCPVVTVGPAGAPAGAFATLLYPTDFSPAAAAAWPMVEAVAGATGAKVILLHVMPEVPEDPRTGPTERAKLLAGYRRRAEQAVADLLARSPALRSRVQTVLTQGVAEVEIVNQAYTTVADAIVMGTHGWSGLLSWTLGSVARRVVRAAPCPVLTVGPRGRREEARRAR